MNDLSHHVLARCLDWIVWRRHDMRVHVSFGRTRHARLDGPPASVLLALGMVLAFALTLCVTLTAGVSELDPARVTSLVRDLLVR